MTPGWIPAEPFLIALNRALKFSEGYQEGEGLYSFIGRRCNLKQDSIEKALKRPEIEFDLADLILCRIGGPGQWQTPPLEEVWESMPPLPDRQCAAPGCTQLVEPKQAGGRVPRFCSIAHRSLSRRVTAYAA